MTVDRTGLILYVNKYEECVSFYSNVLNLSILFEKDGLTCFDFYNTYLLVEKEYREDYIGIVSGNRNYSCLRINVGNVKKIYNKLKVKNIEIDYQEHSWGTVAKFKDPEGNLIAFKDEESFAKQIKDFKNN